MEVQTVNPFTVLENWLKSIESKQNQILAHIEAREHSQSEKKYYSVAASAKKLGVAQITLYRGIKEGRIPSKTVGGRLLIPGSFIDSYK